MTGNELKKAMHRIGITCQQLATLCSWDCDSRIVAARALGSRQIPMVIEMAMEKFLGSGRYRELLDTVNEVRMLDVLKARDKVVVPTEITINRTHLLQLQSVAARYKVQIELRSV